MPTMLRRANAPAARARAAAERARRQARRLQAAELFARGVRPAQAVRRIWAPVGQPLVLRHPFNWQRASMAAALCYGVGGGGALLCFHVHPASYDTDSLTEVIGGAAGFLGGEKATLLWDGLPAHRSKAMAAFLASQRDWLVVERLARVCARAEPGRGAVGQLEGQRAGQPGMPGAGWVIAAALKGIERTRAAWHLPYSFLRHCGLSVA